MTTAVIGATGRVGSAVIERLLAGGHEVRALVRDKDKAAGLFGDKVEIVPTQLDDPKAVAAGLDGARTVFTAMGSVGEEAVRQRVAIQAAAGSNIEQFVRLSVLNTGPMSLGINQRGHWSIDRAAEIAGIPYATIRPAIFSASILPGAAEIRTKRTWTGLADTGRVALIDHRDAADAAVRVLTDPAMWGAHHDLTGPEPMSWPEVMELLSAELGERVTFQTVPDRVLVERLVEAGFAPGMTELLVAREWAIQAGENDRTTTGVQELTGHQPRTVANFLTENRNLFA